VWASRFHGVAGLLPFPASGLGSVGLALIGQNFAPPRFSQTSLPLEDARESNAFSPLFLRSCVCLEGPIGQRQKGRPHQTQVPFHASISGYPAMPEAESSFDILTWPSIKQQFKCANGVRKRCSRSVEVGHEVTRLLLAEGLGLKWGRIIRLSLPFRLRQRLPRRNHKVRRTSPPFHLLFEQSRRRTRGCVS